MKKISISIFFAFVVFIARADEGMWLLYLLGDQTYKDMVNRGLKLSKEQLYNINKSSIKDAIVIFGGGCTGEIVSPEGLIFTNHHCGYGAIAAASTVERNYLHDGFWAKSKAEEIPSKGLSVQFLVRIEDVTNEIETALQGLNGIERIIKEQTISGEIAKRIVDGTALEARVLPFYKGNQYLAFIYERYRDIRLVGAPPESIGKFGGDTDNWEWPRHTGDFSVFRVYMSKEGKAANYASENIPLKPKYYLPVSIKGVKDGDFSMILGYPGSTARYETSFGVRIKTELENPAIVNLRDQRLKLMFNEMKKSDAVRLQLASNYASIANYWKFYDGERKQLLKYDVYGQKKNFEENFIKWSSGKAEYEGLFDKYDQIYKAWWPFAKHRIYLNEGILGSPLIRYASSLQALERTLTKKEVSQSEVRKVADSLSRIRNAFLSDENVISDQHILAAMCNMFYTDINPTQHPVEFYNHINTVYGNLNEELTYKKYAADVFSTTMILNEDKWTKFISNPDSTSLRSDPAYKYAVTFIKNYQKYKLRYDAFASQKNDLDRIYMKGVLQMNTGKALYPDANFTMRLSSGNVKSYRPRDAVFYDYVCTMKGVMEKYVPGDYEFDLPKELIEAVNKKDYGPYKDARVNDLVVTFITTNDITGGNSGSPVINGKGELIGLAFDGNYEALSHKISFDKDLNRTICVDIRYVLWCIDKLGGAKNIINELTLK